MNEECNIYWCDCHTCSTNRCLANDYGEDQIEKCREALVWILKVLNVRREE